MHPLSALFQEIVEESLRPDRLHQLDDPTARKLELRPAEALRALLRAHQVACPKHVPDQRDQGGDSPGCNGDVVEPIGNRHWTSAPRGHQRTTASRVARPGLESRSSPTGRLARSPATSSAMSLPVIGPATLP